VAPPTVQIALTGRMALLHLSQHFGFVSGEAGRWRAVRRCRVRSRAVYARWQHIVLSAETAGQDRSVPCGGASPTSRVLHIVRCPTRSWHLENSVRSKNAALHIGQAFPRGIGGRVAHRVFERAVRFPTNNQQARADRGGTWPSHTQIGRSHSGARSGPLVVSRIITSRASAAKHCAVSVLTVTALAVYGVARA
jgi:hypothetical protein